MGDLLYLRAPARVDRCPGCDARVPCVFSVDLEGANDFTKIAEISYLCPSCGRNIVVAMGRCRSEKLRE
jgi:uncharacterized protein (UPF0212 family)